MKNNIFGPLLRYWEWIDQWANQLVEDVNRHIDSHQKDKDIDILRFDCEMFNAASQDMLDHLSSLGTQDQQETSVNLLASLLASTYSMGRWQGSTDNNSDNKTQVEHLAYIRRKLTPLSDVKLDVVKQLTADLWERKPDFIGNIHGTAFNIKDKANTALKMRWWALSEHERRAEPIGDLQIRAMQTWVGKAADALRKEGRFADL